MAALADMDDLRNDIWKVERKGKGRYLNQEMTQDGSEIATENSTLTMVNHRQNDPPTLLQISPPEVKWYINYGLVAHIMKWLVPLLSKYFS